MVLRSWGRRENLFDSPENEVLFAPFPVFLFFFVRVRGQNRLSRYIPIDSTKYLEAHQEQSLVDLNTITFLHCDLILSVHPVVTDDDDAAPQEYVAAVAQAVVACDL